MGTFTMTAGGARHATASITVELTDWLLGTTYLGPAYTLPISDGGSLHADGQQARTFAVHAGGTLAVTGRNPNHRAHLSGGGRLAVEGQPLSVGLRAGGRRGAVASVATEINQIELGTGLLGPQPFDLSGGGALTAAVGKLSGFGGDFLLRGGGDATAVVQRHARGYLMGLAGGGTPVGLGSPYTALAVDCAEILLHAFPLTLGAPPAPVPAGLIVTLSDTSLDLAPGTLTVFVINGTPDGPILFEITSGATATAVMTTQFDETGAVSGLSVPVVVSAEGTYGLRVTDTTRSLTATATFTVAAIESAATIGVPVTTPPTNVQVGAGVKKWVFQDPANGDTYHFPINPNKMTSPHAPKRITFMATTAINGNKLAFEGQASPVDWKFEGVLFEKAQYDAFVTWLNKRNRVWVTDHWGRAWLIYLTAFEPVPRRDVNHAWCHDYTISAIIFEGPVNPV